MRYEGSNDSCMEKEVIFFLPTCGSEQWGKEWYGREWYVKRILMEENSMEKNIYMEKNSMERIMMIDNEAYH